MPRKKPTRKDNRYEYKITLGRDIHGKPLRKSFYSTVSLADAKKKAEEFRVASEVSRTDRRSIRPEKLQLRPVGRAEWLRGLQAAVCQPQRGSRPMRKSCGCIWSRISAVSI